MTERYRKFGRVVRRENDALLHIEEAGEAIERGDAFECAPAEMTRDLPSIDAAAVVANADEVARLGIERMIVSSGVALHEFEGREWADSSTQMHVSIARPPYRALVDVGNFDVGRVARVADALTRAKRREVKAVRLDESVGAALLPRLAGTGAMKQAAAPYDGKGLPIEEVPVTPAAPPNWYRPSYRSRPVRAWFNLRVEEFGDLDRDVPEAIALLAPVAGPTLQLLCAGDVPFLTTITFKRIVAARPTTTWFPIGAGCYGAEMVVIV